MDKSNKHYAVINIGTLKTKCLVAFFDGKDRIVPQYRSNNLTCFGCEMLENEGAILEKFLERTIQEILKLKKIVEGYNSSQVRLFATHALRDAKNKDWVIEQIKKKTGYEVEVVGAEREGKLYFQAVLGDFTTNRDYVVVDMGGGSCQVLIGSKKGIAENFSFQTGAQFLHEKFIEDPHNPESFTKERDMKRIKEYLENKYSAFKDYSNSPPNLPLIYGSTNIIDLLKAIKLHLEPHQDSSSHPYKTHPQHLTDFVSHIIQFPHAKRDEMYPLQKGYMWGVDKAFLNILNLCEKFNSPYIIPTNASIVEGFLYEMRKLGK